ncbi:transporter substrate-binding domain-containing protein [Pseudonocardia endophytica]|uniref:Amino acid ABC transporter substrate-binding protein (PAAT family) n=1 Tax=Pseudonocardia endophytica TaxID=401976 RepID=A0A4R1HIN7_PSEEN|nr:transporter substrate-binding domain-containing protein [Pseudonocardia endophytica]TCK22117.1 amino acid ABC transporter substrate-binding protein (PAAT family) [Pseudonocardia endophytica]
MLLTRRRTLATAAAAALLSLAAACGGGGGEGGDAGGTTAVQVGALSNGAAKETTLDVATVESIRAELPAQVRDAGVLNVGLGLLPAGSPPLGYTGTDDKTLTGAEPDYARLVGAVLGLKVELNNATWQNLFVGIDSGRTDVGFSNITVTEERKKKYDFATYRLDNLAFETLASKTFAFTGDPQVLAGKKIYVGAGTNQERILLQWQSQLRGQGKNFDVVYFPDSSAVTLALESGKIDAAFEPNPSAAYHVTQSAGTPNPKAVAGTYSGAGSSLQGLIAATSKKDSGLAKPIADATNHLIQNGQYEQWLRAWNLSNEAVKTSQVNPPGLPITNS